MTVKSTMSTDGVLTIKGPKKTPAAVSQKHVIPIEHTTAQPTIQAAEK